MISAGKTPRWFRSLPPLHRHLPRAATTRYCIAAPVLVDEIFRESRAVETHSTKLTPLDPEDYMRHDARMEAVEIEAGRFFLMNVTALMWMVLGLGSCPTLP